MGAGTNGVRVCVRVGGAGVGRWLNRDPIGIEGGINIYVYSQNNSISLVDPYGLQDAPPVQVPPVKPGNGPDGPAVGPGGGCNNNGGPGYPAFLIELDKATLPLLALPVVGPMGRGATCVAKGAVEAERVFYGSLNMSTRYWVHLWNTGRSTPFMRAQSVLAGCKNPIPDPRGRAGFYKYVHDGWELIYNPATNEIWHLCPAR